MVSFETGYAANEFDLQQKLNAFILSIDGWTKISQPDVFDSVYFSSGTDGFNDIYIRTVAGLSENPADYSKNQKDFGDGYVGFLNFFAYQYFPPDGDGYDGYGEAGKLGPLLYYLLGWNSYAVYTQRIAHASGSNSKWDWVQAIVNEGDGTWVEFYNMPMFSNNAAFDGRKYFYFWTSNSGFYRWDISTEHVDILIQSIEETINFIGLACYTDPKTRKEYVWYMKDDSFVDERDDGTRDPIGRSKQLYRWNVDAGVLEGGFTGPDWPDTGDRESVNGSLIWDGHKHLYAFRGSDEPNWAKYHIESDTWTNLVDMPSNHYTAEGMTWLDKRVSGFDYHRIYWVSGVADTVYYINIDEDSGNPVGSWTSAGSTPTAPGQYGSQMIHNGRDRWFYNPAGTNRSMYYADIDDGTLSWNLISSTYFPTTSSRNNTMAYIDGYAARVRTSLYDRTQYWFIGDIDRIIVISKDQDLDKYSFCYMGAINPYSSLTPHAITTAPIYAGTSVEIPIDLRKGEFEVGKEYSIADATAVTPGAGEIIGEIENIARKYKPAETFTTTNVIPGVSITVSSLQNNYPTGARITFDPQPVGITLNGIDKIQMLNTVNTVSESGGWDMAENLAKLGSVDSTIIDASANDARRNTYALWPVIILNTLNEAAYSGSELRGSLIGVFATSNSGTLTTGDTIIIGTNIYMIFDVETSQDFLYVFGPVASTEE